MLVAMFCCQASNGALTLCMLPKSASKLAGKVLVRIVHGSAGSKGVYLAVSTDAEHKCLRFQSINLAVRTCGRSDLILVKPSHMPTAEWPREHPACLQRRDIAMAAHSAGTPSCRAHHKPTNP